MREEPFPFPRCPKCGSGNIVGYQGVWECMDCGYKFRPELETISRRPAIQERKPLAIQKSRSLKRIFALVLAFIIVFSFGVILGYGAGLSNVFTKTITVTKTITKSYTGSSTVITSPSTSTSQSSIIRQASEVITLREIKIYVEPSLIDNVKIFYSLKVRNNVDRHIEYQSILKVKDKELVCMGMVGPYEEGECSIQPYNAIDLDRPIGVRKFQGELLIVNPYQRSELYLRKELEIRIPIIGFGEIIPPEKLDYIEDIQVGIMSWFESEKACEGPFVGGDYYIFKASKGMKFVILKLNFTNVGKRVVSTHSISNGEIRTNTGNVYPMWGYWRTEKEREASEEELETICPIHEKRELLQGESSIEYIIFEIRENEEPVEALLMGIPYIIVFQD